MAADQFVAASKGCACGAARGLRGWGAPERPLPLRLHAFSVRRLHPCCPERPPGQVRDSQLLLQTAAAAEEFNGAAAVAAAAAVLGWRCSCSQTQELKMHLGCREGVKC